jgi:hypothetical protein
MATARQVVPAAQASQLLIIAAQFYWGLLLAPIVQLHGQFIWPLALQPVFQLHCQFIWPLALQPVFQLHGQFIWHLALQALFFVCCHVNQKQAATYDHEKPTMQTHTHTPQLHMILRQICCLCCEENESCIFRRMLKKRPKPFHRVLLEKRVCS